MIIVSIISACINCHRTNNFLKIATWRMFICVFTDSALRFPLRVCIDSAELGVKVYIFRDSIGIVTRRVNVRIDFNRVLG